MTLPLFRPYVAREAANNVARVLASGYIGQGPRVDEFESQLRPWIGDAVTTNSGTSALWLAYDLAGIASARWPRVIATPMTCLATVAPLAHMNVEVLWADCDPRTGLIDVDDVRGLMLQYEGSVQAVVAVDYGGQMVDYDSLRTLCDNNGAAFIADRAHSFGAYFPPLAAPHFAAYSFQAIKHLTTGDGGALACIRPRDHAQAKLKRWFSLDRAQGGFRCEQEVATPGYKFHMNDIAAAVGIANLPHVGGNINLHRRHAAAYDQAGLGHQSQGGSCWLHTLHVEDRELFIRHMAGCGVQCARAHARCDTQPIFRTVPRPLPGVTEFDRTQVSVPVGWWLSDEDVQHVIRSVEEYKS
jgi:dTDP-4-amino-4,6-dideoxygalactose transaminase